jgi:hypothetical protein
LWTGKFAEEQDFAVVNLTEKTTDHVIIEFIEPEK